MCEGRKIIFSDTLTPQMREQWLEFWSSHRHASWRQHPDSAILSQASGSHAVYILGLKDTKLSMVALFSYHHIWPSCVAMEAVCMRGPVFDDVIFGCWALQEIQEYFRKKKVGTLRIGPYWRFPEAKELEDTLSAKGWLPFEKTEANGRRMTACVDIGSSEEGILKSFTVKTRAQVNRAQRLGIEFRIVQSPKEGNEFFQHLNERDKRRGIIRLKSKEIEAIIKVVIPRRDLGAIINAYHKGAFLGGLFLARGGRTAFLSKFVVSDCCKALFPTLRLAPSVFFQGMLWAKAQGCEEVDFEGYTEVNSDRLADDKFYINRYKAGFNPVPCQTLGQFYVIANPSVSRVHRFLIMSQRAARLPRRLIYRTFFAYRRILVAHRELHQQKEQDKNPHDTAEHIG